MEAIREMHDVLGGSVTIRLPASFAARRVEVIVLAATDDVGAAGRPRQRRPAPGLAGTIVRNELIEPAVNPDEWGGLQ